MIQNKKGKERDTEERFRKTAPIRKEKKSDAEKGTLTSARKD